MSELLVPSEEKIAAIARAKGIPEDMVRMAFEGNAQLEAGEPVGTVYRDDATGDTVTRVMNGSIPMWLRAHLADGIAPSYIEGQLPENGWTLLYGPDTATG